MSDLIAAFDQMRQWLADIASLSATYRKHLIAQGFSEHVAELIAEDYAYQLHAHVFGDS